MSRADDVKMLARLPPERWIPAASYKDCPSVHARETNLESRALGALEAFVIGWQRVQPEPVDGDPETGEP